MTLPNTLLLSDLLRHRVRCDQGLDHGYGIMPWMHPPVHRLLGWVSKPSSLKSSRDVWRLNQLKGIGSEEAFVKGNPADSDHITLDRLPTLIFAELINNKGEKIGNIADLIFDCKTGKIFNYLISRTDPRIPGTSRWKMNIDSILDQQPGMVSINLNSLDELPLVKSSLRQDFIKKTQKFREQINDFSDKASHRLEGWLEESPLDQYLESNTTRRDFFDKDPLEEWDDDLLNINKDNLLTYENNDSFPPNSSKELINEEDPWI